MFCKNCGRQIPDNAAFCPACGTKRSGGDSFGKGKSGRDIKDLPSYAKENDLNRSDDAIDTNRQGFRLSDSSQKKFSLSDSGQKKFSLSGSEKKFSLSDKGRDSGDGIVRISANREPAAPPKNPTGFVNPLKDSGKTVFHDEPAGNAASNTPGGSMSAQPDASAPEASATPPGVQAASVVPENDSAGGNAGGQTGGQTGEKTGFVNPLKDSGQQIHWGSDGDRSELKNAEVVGDPSEIDSHMGFAIFTLLCCCQPTSILAIIFAIMVNQEVQKGNYEQAQKYSNLVNIFCWISIGLSIFCGGISSLTNIGEWSATLNSSGTP